MSCASLCFECLLYAGRSSLLRATNGQIRPLRILLTHQRCTMRELAGELDLATPTMTALVKRLLTQGFVECVRDEQDWRMVWVLPTERGSTHHLYDNPLYGRSRVL